MTGNTEQIMAQMLGTHVQRRRSIAFMKKIQMKTVARAMKLRSPCTMDFDWDSTISTRDLDGSLEAAGTRGGPSLAARASTGTVNRPSDRPEEGVRVEYRPVNPPAV